MKKKFVLKKNEDFKKLIKEGNFSNNSVFTIYSMKNDLGYSRFGISAGKKHGNAIVRNKLKNQIRMMLHNNIKFDRSYDYLIMVKPKYFTQDYQQNEKKMIELFNQINKRCL